MNTSNPDPTQQHQQPEREDERLPAPGRSGSVTEQMGDEPDHGEETYEGSGQLTDQVAPAYVFLASSRASCIT